MDDRLLCIILGSVFLLVVAFALGMLIAEWNQKQIRPEAPPVIRGLVNAKRSPDLLDRGLSLSA